MIGIFLIQNLPGDFSFADQFERFAYAALN